MLNPLLRNEEERVSSQPMLETSKLQADNGWRANKGWYKHFVRPSSNNHFKHLFSWFIISFGLHAVCIETAKPILPHNACCINYPRMTVPISDTIYKHMCLVFSTNISKYAKLLSICIKRNTQQTLCSTHWGWKVLCKPHLFSHRHQQI